MLRQFQFYRKLLTYYSTCICAFWGVNKAIDVNAPAYLVLVVGVTLFPIIGLYVWLEERDSIKQKSEITAGGGDPGLIFDLVDVLDGVQIAPRDDEKIALISNKIVREELDKFCISYRKYREWRKRNKMIFTAIIDRKGELIGFFDVFLLKSDTAEGIFSGKIKENDIKLKDIVDEENIDDCKCIYIASICINKYQKSVSAIIAREVTILKLYEYIEKTYLSTNGREFIAYAHTKPGEKLLHRV